MHSWRSELFHYNLPPMSMINYPPSEDDQSDVSSYHHRSVRLWCNGSRFGVNVVFLQGRSSRVDFQGPFFFLTIFQNFSDGSRWSAGKKAWRFKSNAFVCDEKQLCTFFFFSFFIIIFLLLYTSYHYTTSSWTPFCFLFLFASNF